MTIEQAKECLESIDILKYRDDDKNYFFDDVKDALDIAIKSLDMWDNVLVDLENLSENMVDEVGGSKFTVDFIIKMIKEYREEVEK